MESFNEIACRNILAEMRSKKLSRREMAEAMKITYNQMCNLLNHRCALSIDRLYEIANILDVPVSSLLV